MPPAFYNLAAPAPAAGTRGSRRKPALGPLGACVVDGECQVFPSPECRTAYQHVVPWFQRRGAPGFYNLACPPRPEDDQPAPPVPDHPPPVAAAARFATGTETARDNDDGQSTDLDSSLETSFLEISVSSLALSLSPIGSPAESPVASPRPRRPRIKRRKGDLIRESQEAELGLSRRLMREHVHSVLALVRETPGLTHTLVLDFVLLSDGRVYSDGEWAADRIDVGQFQQALERELDNFGALPQDYYAVRAIADPYPTVTTLAHARLADSGYIKAVRVRGPIGRASEAERFPHAFLQLYRALRAYRVPRPHPLSRELEAPDAWEVLRTFDQHVMGLDMGGGRRQ